MTEVRMITDPMAFKVKINFAYDASLVALIKDSVPGYERSYDPATKAWSVGLVYLEFLRDRMRAMKHTVVIADINDPPPAPPVSRPAVASTERGLASFFAVDDAEDGFDPKQTAADLLAALPERYHGRVFRAMAKQLYPDLYSRKS